MTVATKILMGSGAVAEPYVINQSLIFQPNAHLLKNVGSASNRQTWTWSAWVKRSKITLSNDQMLFNAADNGSDDDSTYFAIRFARTAFGAQTDALVVNAWNTNYRITNRVFRDPSAWYHIVVVLDTTQSTANNRVKVYINGTQETSFQTTNNPSQNATLGINVAEYHVIGAENISGSNRYFSGQLAEVNFVDGTALTPSSFGETNGDTGQWIPKEYGGSYGTNGFYFKFASGAIGTDSSGEGNNYTASNLANSDVVIDTPTDNFATMNPIYISGDTNTYSEGNLKIATATTGGGLAVATIVPTAGKYYAEFKMTAGNPSYGYVGVTPVTTNSKAPAYMTFAVNSIAYYGYNGQIITYPNDQVLSTEAAYGVNDVIGVAIDYDNSTIKWYKNNALQYTKTSAVLTDVTFGFSDSSGGSAQTMEINFGQKGFAYTPPSGYTTLSTKNLPDPAIPLPSAQFNSVVWTGNSTDNRVIPVGFAADLTWFKQRTGTNWHGLLDTVRGNSNPNVLHSNATNAAGDWTYIFKGHTSTGFTVGTNAAVNANSNTYVAWSWKANGSGSTDTSGDIDAVVSANQAAGFSVVTWTATGSNTATIPHGLGVAPEIIFYKARSTSGNWNTWTTAIDGSNDSLLLNTNAAKSNNSGSYGNLTSSFFPNWGLGNGITMVAYSFASKPGFSKIGVYTGNGSATAGPFVNCGFKPAWVVTKNTSAARAWLQSDNKRSPSNVVDKTLSLDQNAAEDTYAWADFLSNGFKIRNTSASVNTDGNVYLYMAFAESPFKTANAR